MIVEQPFQQALIAILIKQIIVVEQHQNLAYAGKKNDLYNNVACLVNIMGVVEGCNELELTDITPESIKDFVEKYNTEEMLKKSFSVEG